jgi:hypothetical protein
MTKRILLIFLLAIACFASLFSCKKTVKSTTDPTLNYFPLQLGKYVTYAVDSFYYRGDVCVKIETRCQLKYAITDTYTDNKKRLSYIMDVYFRPYNGGDWIQQSVVLLTTTPTPVFSTATPKTTSLLYTQDRTQFVKLIFPIQNGYTWQGNQYAQVQDSAFTYLKNWNYTYQNMGLSYNNGNINFDNTVTVLEDDESTNYPNVDSLQLAYRTYAKEVYAYNVGMIYKEWTHYTYRPTPSDTMQCWDGYSVIMKAIDHN